MLICSPNKDLTCEIKKFKNGKDAVLCVDDENLKMLRIKTEKDGFSLVSLMSLEEVSKAPDNDTEKREEIIKALEYQMLAVLNKASMRYSFEQVQLEAPDVLHQFATQICSTI